MRSIDHEIPSQCDIPVQTKSWCAFVMVPCASFMSMLQLAFFASQFDKESFIYTMMVVFFFVGIISGLLLLARDEYPLPTFLIACALVIILPFDSAIALMALTSLLARRSGPSLTICAIAAASCTAVISQFRDAIQPPEASFWHLIFAESNTGERYGTPMVLMISEQTLVITAVIMALVETLIATLIGLHIRSKTLASLATTKERAAQEQIGELKTEIINQRFAEAVAAETHDTLAHSLSLLALNATALGAESRKIKNMAQQLGSDDLTDLARQISTRTEDIRKQAAGALDEAHSIIDMLRHPEQMATQPDSSDETSLTRESLDTLISEARSAGMQLNTWIDIRQLNALDGAIGKIAYRAVQEGLTNARRHASGEPVSIQVDANPEQGVHVHISNPTSARAAQQPLTQSDGGERTGAGLPGITARVEHAGGTCRYGFDSHNAFHLDVQLPWVE